MRRIYSGASDAGADADVGIVSRQAPAVSTPRPAVSCLSVGQENGSAGKGQ